MINIIKTGKNEKDHSHELQKKKKKTRGYQVKNVTNYGN